MFDFPIRKSMIFLKTHIFKLFFCLFGLVNQKTYIFKLVFGFCGFWNPQTEFQCHEFEIAKLTIEFLSGDSKTQKTKKNNLNMCVFWFTNPKNPKNQFKYVCFQRDMPETISHSNILGLDVIRWYWKGTRSELEWGAARIDSFP